MCYYIRIGYKVKYVVEFSVAHKMKRTDVVTHLQYLAFVNAYCSALIFEIK